MKLSQSLFQLALKNNVKNITDLSINELVRIIGALILEGDDTAVKATRQGYLFTKSLPLFLLNDDHIYGDDILLEIKIHLISGLRTYLQDLYSDVVHEDKIEAQVFNDLLMGNGGEV